MMNGYQHEFVRRAREHGVRAASDIRTIDRAVAIARRQGMPCLPELELHRLAVLAWAEAKTAAHYARLSEERQPC